MKKILLSSAALLLLAGCARSSLKMDISFDTEDPSKLSMLSAASENVVERMVFALEEEIPTISMEDKGDDKIMTVTVKNKETADMLAINLTTPLMFRVMIEAGEDEEADLENENFGRFKEVGITEKSVEWVEAEALQDGTSTIQINFTEEGSAIWTQVLEENKEKKVGIFARGGLVAAHTIQEGGFKSKIIISGIPSSELAQVFADDVNVGAYVTFTRVQ
ncbi:MAG: hypothetical protein K9M03_00975 [Kiritimatiellales bacterium]|nr:hypothetical protein [Kiritimatiellales bacterium]